MVDTHDPASTHPDIAVVPMNYAGEVLLLRDGAGLALPTGTIADGERAEDAARHILQAATGFRAEALFPLGTLAGQAVQVFLARNLEPIRRMTDAIYQGTTERASVDDLESLDAAGRLRDPVVVAALTVVRQALTGQSDTDWIEPDQTGSTDG